MTSITEPALWAIYNHVYFNNQALQHATELLPAIQDGLAIVYLIDFSDIHPWIYPERAEKYFEKEEMVFHGPAVRNLAEKLFTTDFSTISLCFGISPGSQLEVFESLRHGTKRIDTQITKYFPPHIIRDITLSPKKFQKHIQTLNWNMFLSDLREIIRGDFPNDTVKKPADAVLKLIESHTILPAQEVLPRQKYFNTITKKKPNTAAIDKLINYFANHPRYDPIWGEKLTKERLEHNMFHDTVDIYNLVLTKDLRDAFKGEKVFLGFLTHTQRVLMGGKVIKNAEGSSVSHSSVVPLILANYVMKEGKQKLDKLLEFGLSTTKLLTSELRSINEILELDQLSKPKRDERLKEERVLKVNDRILRLYMALLREVYEVYDPDVAINFKELIEDEGKIPHEEIKFSLEDFRKLIEKKRITDEVAEVSKSVISGRFSGGLSGLYMPQEGYAKDLIDWIKSI